MLVLIMKRVIKTMLACAFLVLIAGCVSMGTEMSAEKLSMIQPGVTTKDQMLQMFGAPMSLRLGTNGKLVMDWSYSHVTAIPFAGPKVQRQQLEVLFGTNDVVEKFSLTDDINKPK